MHRGCVHWSAGPIRREKRFLSRSGRRRRFATEPRVGVQAPTAPFAQGVSRNRSSGSPVSSCMAAKRVDIGHSSPDGISPIQGVADTQGLAEHARQFLRHGHPPRHRLGISEA